MPSDEAQGVWPYVPKTTDLAALEHLSTKLMRGEFTDAGVRTIGAKCLVEVEEQIAVVRQEQEENRARAAKAKAEEDRVAADKERLRAETTAAEAQVKALSAILDECRAQWLSQNSKCVDLPESERTTCQEQCATKGSEAYKAALANAQTTCALAKETPKCDVSRPPQTPIAEARFKEDLSKCAQGCRTDRKDAAEQQARAAREARAVASANTSGSSAKDTCMRRCRISGQECVSSCLNTDQNCAMKCVRQRNTCWNSCN
jgi:hypothetical protein